MHVSRSGEKSAAPSCALLHRITALGYPGGGGGGEVEPGPGRSTAALSSPALRNHVRLLPDRLSCPFLGIISMRRTLDSVGQ